MIKNHLLVSCSKDFNMLKRNSICMSSSNILTHLHSLFFNPDRIDISLESDYNSLIAGASKEDAKETEKQSPKDGTDLAENTNQSSSTLEGLEDNDSKGASGNSHNSGHGTRLTRSRANQGTPGPSEQGSDSPSKLKTFKKFQI